ncbi:hypothetical protein Tco_1031108 [Tanacetum coccineum]|uniref:Uncharacterized protein n=1 Tax=Tanacetum coccineum TaxID=301880 RepID=A0ABQ5G824_9ASTR
MKKGNKSENKGKVPTKIELVLEQTQQATSYEVSVSTEGVEDLKRKVKIKGEKKEALLTLRQKLVLERFNTSVGNPDKEILFKLNLPDHRSILIDSKEHMKMDVERQSIKVKELQDKRILKAFKLSYQEKYEHVGPKSQDHEMARLQDDVKEVMFG